MTRQVGAALYQSARWKALRAAMLTRYPLCQCDECHQAGRVLVAYDADAHGSPQ